MKTGFYTNYSEESFLEKVKKNLDTCQRFYFSVSFIKKPGLKLIAPNIEAALSRGASGKLITSTYQNFTDIDSLTYFLDLQGRNPDRFACHLDQECFSDGKGNQVGFHSKGYLFEFSDHTELLVGSSNITIYALLKNVEWDVSVIDVPEAETYQCAKAEFDSLWKQTLPLSRDLIDKYKAHLFYSIERWDMDYEVANSEIKPNYMQRRALKELNRIRAIGATKALIQAAAGSGKTYLAAFDVLNFNPRKMLYIVHEGSILMNSFETFQRVFGSEHSYGIYNAEFKEFDRDFVFSTNVTMANSLELFDPHTFDYIIIDECHHSTADTYRKIIEYFEPQFLLGITATPERMDGDDVYGIFDQNVPYELRLRDAIINGLVVPFKYYGIRDELIEYGIQETRGHKFVEQFSDEAHCDFIYRMIEKHRLPNQKLKALAFCRDISHAIRMSQAMSDYYKTQYLTGKNTIGERVRAYKDLQDDSSELEILFTVDILNEGVDIPGVNMVLFLRPTESQTIFIQQLGRGLRKYEGKQFVIMPGLYSPASGVRAVAKNYINKDYQVDRRYRYFYFYYDKLEDNSGFEGLRQLVENIYTNEFLNNITANWSKSFVEDEGYTQLKNQLDFYKEYIKYKKERVVVIISDALRYEVGKELFEKLQADERCEAKISAMQSVLPSITSFGMAALLPHNTITIDNEYRVLCDGQPCLDLKQREAILQKDKPNSRCIQFDEIKNSNQAKMREILTGKDIIYVYHNQIDARGDKAATENEVFVACEEAVAEIMKMIRDINARGNTHYFIVTADHGFIYKRDKLNESDKVSAVANAGKRYAIIDDHKVLDGVATIPMKTYLNDKNDSRYVLSPVGSDVFKVSGAGVNYVHGGCSPQEMIIPVIEVKTERGRVSTSNAAVDLVSLTNKITNLNIKLDFLQCEALSDTVKETIYRIFFMDENGNKISNENVHHADSKETDTTKRVFTLRFTFKNQTYSKGKKYFLVVVDDKTGMETMRREVIMDLAFAGDFGFTV